MRDKCERKGDKRRRVKKGGVNREERRGGRARKRKVKTGGEVETKKKRG